MGVAAVPTRATARERREALGLSRAELARRALVDVTTLWRFERGGSVGDLTRLRVERALDEAEQSEAAA